LRLRKPPSVVVTPASPSMARRSPVRNALQRFPLNSQLAPLPYPFPARGERLFAEVSRQSWEDGLASSQANIQGGHARLAFRGEALAGAECDSTHSAEFAARPLSPTPLPRGERGSPPEGLGGVESWSHVWRYRGVVLIRSRERLSAGAQRYRSGTKCSSGIRRVCGVVDSADALGHDRIVTVCVLGSVHALSRAVAAGPASGSLWRAHPWVRSNGDPRSSMNHRRAIGTCSVPPGRKPASCGEGG
jgi:hypothetical protein